MDHNHAPWIDDQLPESIERPGRKRVDEYQLLVCGYLDQTEIGDEGLLTDELRVETDHGAGLEMLAASNQTCRIGDNGFGGADMRAAGTDAVVRL
jgi:hypothetical protein